MDRTARVERETRETKVTVELDIDGSAKTEIATGVGFFDHLLTSLGHHALFDLRISADGDLQIDDHHVVEDTAIAFGTAIRQALGDRVGITRFGDARVPMDEALAEAIVDVSGRPYAAVDIAFTTPSIGAMSTQNVPHALETLATSAELTLHLSATGRNDHHVAEAAIKALARALRAGMAVDPRRAGVPSTKAVL